MHTSEIERRYGSLYKKWRNCKLDDTQTHFDGGETKAEVRTRIFEALNEYVSENRYINIAVSAHGIVISQILLSLGIELTDIPNGTIMKLTHENSRWKFQGFIED